MRKSKWFRLILVVIAFVMAFSLTACSLSQNDDDDEDERSDRKESKKTTSLLNKNKSKKGAYENLVINDFPVEAEDYILVEHGQSTYIMLDSEIITYPFKIPYASTSYPELSTDNGQITMTWSDQGEIILKINMVEGSQEAFINSSDEPIDMGVSPKTLNDKLFIPINLIAEALKLTETYDRKYNVTLLHSQTNFPEELLVGNWSDTHTDIFTLFEDTVSGLETLSSYASGYAFEGDGTYRQLLVTVGGFTDKLIQCKGQYKILGNTIICYDIYETLYEGTPFKLVYKNKKLDNPSYDFIYNYNPDENSIDLDGFWLYKIN